MAPAENVGPHPSHIQVADSYIFEQEIQMYLAAIVSNQQKDGEYRLPGVQILHDVRNYMNLPAQTYTCACLYFHKFRLFHATSTYQCEDAAMAALLVACKIQDTLKKSNDILCAAHNMRVSPSEYKSNDDPMFYDPHKLVIGLERLMLESSKFDFRSRFPHKHVIKLAKLMNVKKDVAKIALDICNDMYKTFAPLKQTTHTMAAAVLELAVRITGASVAEGELKELQALDDRAAVMETMLDLVDLYTHSGRITIIGPKYDVNIFITLRISLNAESQGQGFSRSVYWNGQANGAKVKGTPKTPVTPASPANGRDVISPAVLSPREVAAVAGRKNPAAPGSDGTHRFMLDADKAKQEKAAVEEYSKVEFEEYEVEVEEPTAPKSDRADHGGHRGRDDRHNGGGYRGGRRGRR